MKKLDLNNYGVKEMSKKEMGATDGGIALWVVAVLAVGLAIDYLQDGKIDGAISI